MDVAEYEHECPCCSMLTGQVDPPGGVIYENDHWIVTHALEPDLQPGRLLISLKRHCVHLSRISPDEANSLGMVIANTAFALLQVFKPSSTYVIFFGEHIKHVHFFILPRMPEMPALSYSLLTSYLQKLGLKKTYSHDEIAWFANQLRARLVIEDEI